MPVINVKRIEKFFFFALFILTVLIATERNRDRELFTWENILWADQAGYYIYNPALFIYHFNAEKLPSGIDNKTGDGFRVDYKTNKIITKYSYGVALLQLPFYLLSELATVISGQQNSGFSGINVFFIILAGAFYLCLGLVLLYGFLITRYPRYISAVVIILLYSATNLFYYTIDSPGMSHVYSFFLFCLFIYYFRKTIQGNNIKPFNIFILSLIFALIVLIRPTNALLILFLFFYQIQKWEELKNRILTFFKPLYFFIWLSSLLIFFIPQLLYGYYISGHLFHYSYTSEGFSNFPHPQVSSVLFAPKSGLVLYNPVFLFILAGILIMIFHKKKTGWLSAVIFLLVLIITAAWHDPTFGCSFGSRNFTEYHALFSLPLAYLINLIFNIKKDLLRLLTLSFIFLAIMVNLKLTYSFNKCFFGSKWDFYEYLYLLKSQKIHSYLSYIDPLPYKKDFRLFGHKFRQTGIYSFPVNEKNEYYSLLKKKQSELGYVNFRKVTVKINADFKGKPDGALLVTSLDSCGKSLYWNACNLSNYSSDWNETKLVSFLPWYSAMSNEINIYIWNKGEERFFVKDIYYRLE